MGGTCTPTAVTVEVVAEAIGITTTRQVQAALALRGKIITTDGIVIKERIQERNG